MADFEWMFFDCKDYKTWPEELKEIIFKASGIDAHLIGYFSSRSFKGEVIDHGFSCYLLDSASGLTCHRRFTTLAGREIGSSEVVKWGYVKDIK